MYKGSLDIDALLQVGLKPRGYTIRRRDLFYESQKRATMYSENLAMYTMQYIPQTHLHRKNKKGDVQYAVLRLFLRGDKTGSAK